VKGENKIRGGWEVRVSNLGWDFWDVTFGQVTLAYFHVVASQWTRVALNPFQVIQWST
jgi:hypothetical protein